MFSQSPLPCQKSTLTQLGFYQAGSDVYNVMELFRDAHKFEVTLAGLPLGDDAFMDFEMNGGLAGSALGSLNGVQAYNTDLQNDIDNGHGFTNRQIKQSDYIPDDDEQQPTIPSTNSVCGEYPIHTYTNGQVSVIIDFGRTETDGALFYPYIKIDMSNGMNNYNGAMIMGSVDVDRLNGLIIYGNTFGFAYGTIKVSERYSDIAMSSIYVNPSDTITLGPVQGKTFSGFKDVTQVIVGGQIAQFTLAGDTINVTVPKSVYTDDFITFIAGNNKFYSPAILRITTPKT